MCLELSMKRGIGGGEEVGIFQAERSAIGRSNAAAGLADDQYARRHVPYMRGERPEEIETPGGQVAEVQGRGAGPPDGLAAGEHFQEQEHVRRVAPHVGRKADDGQGVGQF